MLIGIPVIVDGIFCESIDFLQAVYWMVS